MFTSAGIFKTSYRNTVAVLPLKKGWIFDGLWGRAGVIFDISDIFPTVLRPPAFPFVYFLIRLWN